MPTRYQQGRATDKHGLNAEGFKICTAVDAAGADGLTFPVMTRRSGSQVFTQQATASALDALSGEAADTSQTLTVTGINNAATPVRVSVDIELNGTSAATDAGSVVFDYVESAALDSKCAGAVSVRLAGGAVIGIIPAGEMSLKVAHKFFFNGSGACKGLIDQWGASLTSVPNNIHVQLRYYPDYTDARGAATMVSGYEVLGEFKTLTASGAGTTTSSRSSEFHEESIPHSFDDRRGGYVALVAAGSSATFVTYLGGALLGVG